MSNAGYNSFHELHERERALSSVRGEFHRCVDYRHQRTVLIEAAPGVGRTAFIRLLEDELTDYDTLLLRAQCSRSEREVGFAVLRQLLQQLPTEGTVHEIATRLERTTLEQMITAPPGAETNSLLAQHDTLTLLRAIAERRPLVIVLDDVSFTDARSADCILYSLRRMQSLPVLLIASATSDAENIAWFRTELQQMHNGIHRIGLNPLSPESTRRIVAERLGFDSPDIAAYCTAVAQGNSLLLHAMLDDQASALDSGAGDPSATAEGSTLGRAVQRCLENLDDSALNVARAMVVLGPTCSANHVASLAGLSPASVQRILERLAGAELVENDDFRHEAIRRAVARQLTPNEHARLHLRAAHQLIQHGASSRDLALHLLQADSTEASWAISTLHEVACQTGTSGEPCLARRCLELALKDERERGKTKAMLLELAWRCDPAQADLHVPGLVELLNLGELHVDEIFVLVRHLLWHGRVAESADTLSKLPLAPDFAHAAAAIRDFRVWLAHAYPPMARLLEDVPARHDSGRDSLFGGADLRSLAVSTLSDVLTNRPDHATVPEARQILRSREAPELTFISTQSALLALVFTDQLAEAARRCDQLLADSATLAAPTWQAVLTGIRAEIHRRCGALGAAARLARSAMEQMSEKSWGVPIAQPLCCLLLAEVAAGHLDEARELVERAVPAAIVHSAQGLVYRYACGRYQLATGSLDQALQSFLSCGELAECWDLDMPTVVPWRESAAEALIGLGKPENAAELLHQQLQLTPEDLPRARGVTLRRLAEFADPREAVTLLTNAAQLLEGSGDRLELTHALTDLSLTLRKLGDPRRARVHAQLAAQITVRLDRESGIAASTRLSPSEGRRPGQTSATTPHARRLMPSPLTRAEQRVAALAAQGLTNREIAQQLFITPSTVEQHLTRIFRKLDVKQRGELPIKYDLPESGLAAWA